MPGEAAGSAALTLVTEATALRPGSALFEEMLAGWRRQQAARRLTGALIDGRERLVRRFCAFTGGLPWQWTAGQAGTWIAEGGWAHSTIRSCQGAVALFLASMCAIRGTAGWLSASSRSAPARCRSCTSGTPRCTWLKMRAVPSAVR